MVGFSLKKVGIDEKRSCLHKERDKVRGGQILESKEKTKKTKETE